MHDFAPVLELKPDFLDSPMAYDSLLLMAIVDVMIIACPLVLLVLLIKKRQAVFMAGLKVAIFMVSFGLGIISFWYLADLWSVLMAVLQYSDDAAWPRVEPSHLYLSRYSVLLGVGSISFGMAYLLRGLIPNVFGDVIDMENAVNGRIYSLQDNSQRLRQLLNEQRETQDALVQSEQRFRELVELLPQTVFEVSTQGQLNFINRAGSETFQLTQADVEAGLNIRDYCVDSDRERLTANFKTILQGEMLGPNEYTYRRKDGSTLAVIISTRPIVRDETIVGVIGIIFDITRRKAIERELETSRTMLRTVLDTIPVRVFWKDTNSVFLGCNKEFAKDARLDTPTNLVGKTDFDIAPQSRAERYCADDRLIIKSGKPKLNYEELRYLPDGSEYWLKTSKIPLLGPDEKVIGILGCYEDITKTRRLSQQLKYLASHDSLTGLVNRHAFEERLGLVVETTQVDASSHALCYLDLDQFKVVNDTCGHSAGDELLNQLGTVLQQHVRHTDTLARLGGDEFAVLMEQCSMQQANRVAEFLRQAIAEFRFTWEGRSFSIGASIGLVPISKETSSVMELLMKADSACYSAKEGGRNRVHVYREDDLGIVQRQGEVQWVSKISEALDQDRFALYAQPIVPLQRTDGGMKHYEILTRLVADNGELVLPGAFFPAAERYNLSPRVDRWVVEKAFAWLLDCPNRLEQLSVCSINLSGHSLSNEEFQLFVENLLQKTKVPPNKICFEITETAAIANLSRVIRFITRLKEKGCRFALDDFGSGLSSFAYLKNLPVDYLKIDGMFVMDILDDPIDLAMVRSINEIGQLMGKETIAEFVENDHVRDKLIDIGVDYAQGFAVGVPVPIDQIM